MAFKKTQPPQNIPDSPEKILLQLPRRKIPGVLLHQGQIMQRYATEAVAAPDVALQLPTGSGKTLVGLLIAEWRRRKFNEKVVYLCPTRQLVNQVVSQAEQQYGLAVNGFVGSKADYSPAAKAEYQSAAKIAVTTYSSLFNSHPYFDAPDVIILDDAHAAENYIAAMWSLRIDGSEKSEQPLFTAISALLRPFVSRVDFARLEGSTHPAIADPSWVDKIPAPAMLKISGELAAIMDQYAAVNDEIKYSWQTIKNHLDACNLFISSKEILIRPLIPPTWTHRPFEHAKQRIFMSATLGEGGDLERLAGRKKIMRIPVPEGMDRQGIGRRFFIFPEMSIRRDAVPELMAKLCKMVPRSVFLVPSKRDANQITKLVEWMGNTAVDAEYIEKSKSTFTGATNVAAVIANRYDGIDFPGDECRLLFIDGLPKMTNLQEKFIFSRMGAGILLRGRIQTRVVQAVGRCTRSPQDYSAVVVTGSEMTDYLSDARKLDYFHPELQAELSFGAEQSLGTTIDEMCQNFRIFIENDHEWEDANEDILAKRAAATQKPHDGIDQLGDIVSDEIDYQRALWDGAYESAIDKAGTILGKVNHPELKGYRALWNYLAGAAAIWGSAQGVPTLKARALDYFEAARQASTGIRWMANIARADASKPVEKDQVVLEGQIERLETLLLRLGVQHDLKYGRREQLILEGIASEDYKEFEEAQKLLGEMLGFQAGNEESDASPDPWWIADDFCIVFEDHSDAKETSTLGANKARQAASHVKWMEANAEQTQLSASPYILPVLVTPVKTAETGAFPHLKDVALWPLAEYQAWAKNVVAVIRELRRGLGGEPDLAWRAQAQSKFSQLGYDAPSLFKKLGSVRAAEYLKKSA